MSCSVDGCSKRREVRGLCGMHYARLRKRGHVGGAAPETSARGTECSVEGCDRAVQSRQLCRMHYARQLRKGDPGPAQPLPRGGEHANRWAGGRYQDSRGYWHVYRPDHPGADHKGYVYEHRLVMEEHIGRELVDDEVVHHVNEDPSDNRIDNLRLMTASEHSRLPHTRRTGRPRKVATI